MDKCINCRLLSSKEMFCVWIKQKVKEDDYCKAYTQASCWDCNYFLRSSCEKDQVVFQDVDCLFFKRRED